ncbi:MAG: ATP-binding cassette domain-containing protein [bacterium]|nr:ATP-binding cassette domain-containing protein [bacterium]
MQVALESVTFGYGEGRFGLRVPRLLVESGLALAVVGPSGSGKTTLLHLIAGILEVGAGRISVGDTVVSALAEPARRDFRIRHVGAVFQEFELLEYLDVRDNILLPYFLTGALTADAPARARADQLAEEVGLGDKLGRRPGHLSHGEKQRVAICRALVTGPGLLLADEPTGNLDPANKAVVLDVLLDQARRTGATLLTVTHDHAELGRFDDVIDVGRFAASTAVADGGA